MYSRDFIRSCMGLTWEEHRRMRELTSAIAMPLAELMTRKRGLGRYRELTLRTIGIVWSRRPEVVLVQNPSLILSLLMIVMRTMTGWPRVIVDGHNEAIRPFINDNWLVRSISRLVIREADLTIVTNSALANDVARFGGRAMILPDRVPTVPVDLQSAPSSVAPARIMVVSTYAADEPISEILTAARLLGDQFRFSVTGRASKCSSELRSLIPNNVELTDFLEEADYWRLLINSHIVLDLTSMPDCLVCGAYEGLAAGRPLVLTRGKAAESLFGNCAVYTDNEAPAIAAAVRQAWSQYGDLVRCAEEARSRMARDWRASADQLTAAIKELKVRTGKSLDP